MHGKIVRTITQDHLHLTGILCEPATNRRGIALIHCHGYSGNFYDNFFLDHIARDVTARGYTFLSFNTRGHDCLTLSYIQTPEGLAETVYGAVIETFEESLLDLAAWLDFIAGRGYDTVALQGHSAGTIKSAHFQARTQDERIKALIFIAPPDIHGQLKSLPEPAWRDRIRAAERMVAQGQGDQLMPAETFRFPIGARAFLSYMHPDAQAAVFNFHDPQDPFTTLGALQQPILGIIGTDDYGIVNDPAGCMALLKAKAVRAPFCDTSVIDGAPHSFDQREHLLSGAIAAWLDRVFAVD